MQSVLDYREKIHDTEEQFRLLRIRYEEDNYAFNQRWAQVDKTRSIYHNAAIKAWLKTSKKVKSTQEAVSASIYSMRPGKPMSFSHGMIGCRIRII